MTRLSTISRNTKETQIALTLTLDGNGDSDIDTGIGFFDHMLTLFAFHGHFDLNLRVKGDLHVDAHHTIEDTGILLGQALLEAFGDKKGICRYAHNYLPMDEALSRTVVDISNRPYHVFECQFSETSIGKFPSAMASHFFCSLAFRAGITLHQHVLYGNNDHHKLEALFKGLGRCLREAATIVEPGKIQSTKGML